MAGAGRCAVAGVLVASWPSEIAARRISHFGASEARADRVDLFPATVLSDVKLRVFFG